MMVIGKDNWGRDYNGGRSEIVAAAGVSKETAENLVAELNAKEGEYGDTYWCIKGDDYKPYKFEGY